MTGQKKSHSFMETCLGTAIGYGVALGTQYLVFPRFDIQTSHTDNLLIAGVFTVVSLIRGYYVRRLFNYLHVKGILK